MLAKLCTVGGNVNWCHHWMGNSIEFPQKIKCRGTNWSSNFTSGYISKGNKITALERHFHSHDYCSVLTTEWKQLKCFDIDRWIKKLYMYQTMGQKSSMRNKGNLPFSTTWLNLGSVILSEASQTEKDKFCLISPVYGN